MELPASSSGETSRPPSTASSEEPLTRHTLASFRSVIINPSTPASLISSTLETLTGHLQLSRDPLLLHHTLKLLTELAHRDGGHSAVISKSVSRFLLSTESTRLATESLDTLASISENDRNFDDSFFVSLCFDVPAPSRAWLLRNAGRFGIRTYLLFTVFLGFTKDPYPYVRQAALDGLMSLSKSGAIEDSSLIQGCYCRAVELLGDTEACVRTAAVHTVSEWGQMLVASSCGSDRLKQSDAVFIKLSSMVRDMSVEVRVAAFDALGKIEMVSVDVLLQTLSKKVLGIRKVNYRSQGSTGEIEALVSTSAGALVHGLEDEFYEVRKSACYSMQKFTALSSEFAGEAINLLTDMLNDDAVAVRLQALETMREMANCGHLSLKVANMHMFLSSLTDNNSLVRDAVRKVLKSVKLPNLEIFTLSVYGLIENLQRYHQDEAKIFAVLFEMGRRHGSFTVSLINKVFQEIEPSSDGKFGFDSARVAAFLVLSISAPLCNRKSHSKNPAAVFSYAVTILGRISCALADEVDQSTLMAYLSHCSKCSTNSVADYKEMGSEISDIYAQKLERGNLPSTLAKLQHETDDQLLKSMNIILAKIKDIWSLVKLGFLHEGLRTLRACKRELAIFASEPAGSSSSVAFTALYLRIVKLLAKISVHFLPTVNYFNYRVGDLDLLLGKLDRRLRDMRFQFIGRSKEEELRVLELDLVSSVLRLSKVEIYRCATSMRKLSAVLSHIEHVHEEASIELSSFVTELKKLMINIPCHPHLFRKVLDHFSLEKYELSGRLECVSAELAVPGNNSENPLYFVRGLPVAIPVEINLSNVSKESMLWLKMMAGEESTRFLFLDAKLYVGSTKFNYSAPFYRTPKALSFTLRISIGMECRCEHAGVATSVGGPRHELTFLTPELDVYLSSA
ncbi:protein SIEL isoform X1 [Punica granatum]|uniref:Protein SIEL isoform X1 n=1 Tax=Punica granatum TaxID=22663 RepID=A0A6P8DUP5_PUNGR|nr:protein SIEL isoform X1 [Punica granatum]